MPDQAWRCSAPAAGDVAQEVASAAVAEVLVVEHAALDPYTPDAYAAALRAR